MTDTVHLWCQVLEAAPAKGFLQDAVHTARGASGLTHANRRGDVVHLREHNLSELVRLTVAGGIGGFEKIQDGLWSKCREVLCEDRSFLRPGRQIRCGELPCGLRIRSDLVGFPMPGTHLVDLIGKRLLWRAVSLHGRETRRERQAHDQETPEELRGLHHRLSSPRALPHQHPAPAQHGTHSTVIDERFGVRVGQRGRCGGEARAISAPHAQTAHAPDQKVYASKMTGP